MAKNVVLTVICLVVFYGATFGGLASSARTSPYRVYSAYGAVVHPHTAHSDVPSQVHSARFPVSTRTHREVLALMDRAEEKVEPKDVGEQALMRGLDTAFPFFRLGLSLV